MYTPAHAWCSQHLSHCTPHSPGKMHMHSCMRAYATVQKLFCHGSYCELILSLAQISCNLSFADLPPAGSTRPTPSCRLDSTDGDYPPASSTRRTPSRLDPPDAVCFKNPSKSTLAHDTVAAAVLHKHHPIIRVGACLIQFVYGSRLHFANRGYPS